MYTPDVLLQRERQDRRYFPVASLHFCELRAAPSKSSEMGQPVRDRKLRLFAVMNTESQQPSSPSSKSAGKGPRQRVELDNSTSVLSRELDAAGIIVFDTSLQGGSGSIVPALRRIPHVLDESSGAASSTCAALMADTCELVVARTDGVFSYSVEDRGAAAGIEGFKQCIGTVGRYVLIASSDADGTGQSTARSSLTVYDLRNKFVSFYYQLPAGDRVLHCLQDGSKLIDFGRSVCLWSISHPLYYRYGVHYHFVMGSGALYREGH